MRVGALEAELAAALGVASEHSARAGDAAARAFSVEHRMSDLEARLPTEAPEANMKSHDSRTHEC